MTIASVPPPAAHTEATRLLCRGVHLDPVFRRRVINELVRHEERPVAPSLGIDAVPVLSHALRARRAEVQVFLLMLGIWSFCYLLERFNHEFRLAVGSGYLVIGDLEPASPLPQPLGVSGESGDEVVLGSVNAMSFVDIPFNWVIAYGVVCLCLWAARRASGRAEPRRATGGLRGGPRAALSFLARLLLALYVLLALLGLPAGVTPSSAVLLPLLLALPVWLHRRMTADVVRRELGPDTFPRSPAARLPATARFRRVGRAISREQHAPLTIYDPFRPFMGMGRPYEPWSLVLELKRSATAPADPEPLTSRAVVDLIRPRLEALSASAATTSRDRLRELEVTELVYLPPGIPRGDLERQLRAAGRHLADAVDEGAEARRHFLRIRVGAWSEQVVVSVLVRVHTQGGMLVLEMVPHVLTPIRPGYRDAEVIEAWGTGSGPREVLRALAASPASTFASFVTTLRVAADVVDTWLTKPGKALPGAPVVSVRELGSVPEVSLFQEMDISRYVKTLRDRIASGVSEALRRHGYRTGEFEQQIINVTEGSVFIGAMSGGAVGVGAGARANSVGKES